ncbi:NAD(P)/FAD-dependent oxidoreductase [Zafaria sp. Z1313]|uniref:NAD(P)/FAD-dependent oxidoreductase n=1 Tax=unclassified Zafaria TaxID=2828765 RepID=UPI002E77E9A3|nr:FAD-dependent oxidoreductase [Zafaria sp. J156]MEE1620021.1 FAD-dependent oxidoreductase [Zafaria sp. J156]
MSGTMSGTTAGAGGADGVLECGVVVIGGGIAGLSLAAVLAPRTGVVLLEAEEELAHHTSSRSAQQLIPSYGPEPVRALTRRTLEALAALPPGPRGPLAWPSSFLMVGTRRDVDAHGSDAMAGIGRAEALRLSPVLRPEAFEAAGLDATSVRTDAAGLIEHHRRLARGHGAAVLTGQRVVGAERVDGSWTVRTAAGAVVRAPWLVDAAGAWADGVARAAGAAPLGLVPLRRTAAYVRVAEPLPEGTPMTAAADDSWYFRREGELVLVSPAESEPAEPGDAQPRAADVADVVRRIEAATTLQVTGVERAWTGLRTEAPDGVPVLGPDPDVPGFFWLAGQGGYGFQTSTGMAELAAALLLGDQPPFGPDVVAALSPGRFRRRATE